MLVKKLHGFHNFLYQDNIFKLIFSTNFLKQSCKRIQKSSHSSVFIVQLIRAAVIALDQKTRYVGHYALDFSPGFQLMSLVILRKSISEPHVLNYLKHAVVTTQGCQKSMFQLFVNGKALHKGFCCYHGSLCSRACSASGI